MSDLLDEATANTIIARTARASCRMARAGPRDREIGGGSLDTSLHYERGDTLISVSHVPVPLPVARTLLITIKYIESPWLGRGQQRPWPQYWAGGLEHVLIIVGTMDGPAEALAAVETMDGPVMPKHIHLDISHNTFATALMRNHA